MEKTKESNKKNMLQMLMKTNTVALTKQDGPSCCEYHSNVEMSISLEMNTTLNPTNNCHREITLKTKEIARIVSWLCFGLSTFLLPILILWHLFSLFCTS